MTEKTTEKTATAAKTEIAKTETTTTDPTSILDKYLTLDEVAGYFGVSRFVVQRWRDVLGLPVVGLGKGHTRVDVNDLDAWLQSRKGARPAEG
jgi:excisionase family DNA binding protein